MSAQTLHNMMLTSQAPLPMMILESCTGPCSRPKVKVSTKRPWVRDRSHAPISQVASADHRNHRRARGAARLMLPAPPGPPLSAVAAAKARDCTASKQYNKLIQNKPDTMGSQRSRHLELQAKAPIIL